MSDHLEGVGGAVLDAVTLSYKGYAGLQAAFGQTPRILQIVPEGTRAKPPKYPYVTFGGIDKKSLPGACGGSAEIILFTHIWDEDKSVVRATNIAEACEVPALELVLPVESGLAIQQSTHELTRTQYDSDRALIFGVCQVKYRISSV